MPRAPINFTVGDWMELAEKVTPETAAGFLPLEHTREKLVGYLEEVSRRFRSCLPSGTSMKPARGDEEDPRDPPSRCRTATLIRKILKDHYGPDSERLAAFGIQPFRPRKRGPRKPKQAKDSAARQDAADPQPSGDPSP